MKFYLFAFTPNENVHVAQAWPMFEGIEPPSELTLRTMGEAYISALKSEHQWEYRKRVAASDSDDLRKMLEEDHPPFTHGVWIVEAIAMKLNFMAAEIESFPFTTEVEAYTVGALWANALNKYAYRGQVLAFPELHK